MALREIDPAEVVLAPAGAEALAVLARLYVELTEAHGETMEEATAAEKLGRMLASPSQRAVIFRHDEAVLGNMLWADLGDHVFVRNYVIVAAHRRRGLRAALFARARAELFPGRPVRLETSDGAAERFWTAQGFGRWSVGMRTDARPGG